MSPTLLHRSFSTDRRFEMNFADNVLPPTFVVIQGRTIWLDTELLPPQSALESVVANAHYAMLKAHLATLKPRRSLDDAYEYSPTARSLAFTLQVTFPSVQTGKKPTAEAHYHRSIERFELPTIVRMREVNVERAILGLDLWQLENGYVDGLTL